MSLLRRDCAELSRTLAVLVRQKLPASKLAPIEHEKSGWVGSFCWSTEPTFSLFPCCWSCDWRELRCYSDHPYVTFSADCESWLRLWPSRMQVIGYSMAARAIYVPPLNAIDEAFKCRRHQRLAEFLNFSTVCSHATFALRSNGTGTLFVILLHNEWPLRAYIIDAIDPLVDDKWPPPCERLER